MIDPATLYAASEAQKPVPTDSQLADIARLAREQQRLERALARREKLVERTKAKLAQVQEHELPDAMAAVGMSDFTLTDGNKVTVAPEYYANIPSADSDKPELQERRADAFQWLRDQGHGPLIKNLIVIECGTGEAEEQKAQRVMRGLQTAGISFNNTESVHASTLKAFVREQMDPEKVRPDGQAFPEKLFGVHVKQVAKVKPAKTKGR